MKESKDSVIAQLRLELTLRDLEIQYLQAQMRDLRNQTEPVPLSDASINDLVDEVKKIVAGVCRIPLKILMAPTSRRRAEIWPKHLAMYFCLKFELGGEKEIANRFHLKVHGSARNAKKAVESILSMSNHSLCKAQHAECLKQIQKLPGLSNEVQ